MNKLNTLRGASMTRKPYWKLKELYKRLLQIKFHGIITVHNLLSNNYVVGLELVISN